MTEEKMKKRLYALHQLQWMMIHGVSLDDVLQALLDSEDEHDHSGYVYDLRALIHDAYEHGFYGGQIWACYEEFCDAELQDESYIKGLILNVSGGEGHMLMEAYEKYRKEQAV